MLDITSYARVLTYITNEQLDALFDPDVRYAVAAVLDNPESVFDARQMDALVDMFYARYDDMLSNA